MTGGRVFVLVVSAPGLKTSLNIGGEGRIRTYGRYPGSNPERIRKTFSKTARFSRSRTSPLALRIVFLNN